MQATSTQDYVKENFFQVDTDFVLRDKSGNSFDKDELDFEFTEEEYRRYILQYLMENEAGLYNLQGKCVHQKRYKGPECGMVVIVGKHPTAFTDFGTLWDTDDEFYCDEHMTSNYDDIDLGEEVPLMYAHEYADDIINTR